jgi:hypothetical protein
MARGRRARHVASTSPSFPLLAGEGIYLHPSPQGRRDGDEGWRLVPQAIRLGLAWPAQAEMALAPDLRSRPGEQLHNK